MVRGYHSRSLPKHPAHSIRRRAGGRGAALGLVRGREPRAVIVVTRCEFLEGVASLSQGVGR